MINFSNYINITAFFIALSIGLFFTYIFSPEKKIIIKWPTPENADKLVYKDYSDLCYKYNANEVACPDNKSLIKNNSIQY
jgi:hypothetical protein